MTSTYNLERMVRWSAIALNLCWLSYIAADAIIGEFPWAYAMLFVLLSLTYLGLYQVIKRGITLPTILKFIALPIFAWGIFVGWGNLISNIELSALVDKPSNMALVLVFLNGPFVVVLLSLLIATPLAIVYEKRAGLVAFILCLPVILISFPGLLDVEIQDLTRLILITELVGLIVLLPYSALLARRFVIRWSGRSSA